jgi:hypothetical protein
MIFAWNDADPLTGNNDWKYHGLNNRAPKPTLLLTFKNETVEQQSLLSDDMQPFIMLFKNVNSLDYSKFLFIYYFFQTIIKSMKLKLKKLTTFVTFSLCQYLLNRVI